MDYKALVIVCLWFVLILGNYYKIREDNVLCAGIL